MNVKFDDLLKEAASLYVEREGEALAGEPAAPRRVSGYDAVRRGARGRVFREQAKRTALIALPAAACLFIALWLTGFFGLLTNSGDKNLSGSPPVSAVSPALSPPPSGTATPEPPRAELVALAAKLPSGCRLTQTDYDHGKTIYHIENALGSEIVLVAEFSSDPPVTQGFTLEKINGMDAYILMRRDYSVLLTQKDGVRCTLTGEFGAKELIEIAEAVI